jgi:hypothetical protein
MHLIGYILLISGFVWLFSWFANSIVPLPRSISIENLQKYHESGNFSGAEVQFGVYYKNIRIMLWELYCLR